MPATHDERPSVLYVSWDGLLDPLGRSQVVPYLTRLARRSCSIWVASLEKSGFDPRMRETVEAELASAGVRWTQGSYLGRGGARAALSGARLLVDLWRDPDLRSVSILHGRGYPASALCCLLRRRRPKAAFLFDMRGFWPDERVDGGVWSARSPHYRVGKWLERALLRGADAVVSLTRRGLEELPRLAGIEGTPAIREVIPTAADCRHFTPGEPPAAVRDRLPRRLGDVLVYSGSLGTWYLDVEMARFVREYRRIRPAHFLCLANNDPDSVRIAAQDAGLPEDALTVETVSYDRLPGWLRRGAAGLSLVQPCRSKVASFPTKIAEYLACGLPVVSTAVGDVESLFAGEGVGIVVRELSSRGLQRAAEELARLLEDPELPARCRSFAERYLSVEVAVNEYAALYDRLLSV